MNKMNKNVSILTGIAIRNGMWNSDFNGQAKSNPYGDFYASDKSLKHAIRRDMHNYLNKIVFAIKTSKLEKNQMVTRTIDERYESLFGKFNDKTPIKDIITNLFKCEDVRQFGLTFPVKGLNLGVHGVVQFSDGINLDKETIEDSQTILSPFKNSNEKSKDKKQATNGTKTALDEAHFLYNGTISPVNSKDLDELFPNSNIAYTDEDFEVLKQSLKSCVTKLNSCSKMGAENEFNIFIICKEGYNLNEIILNDKVSFSRSNNYDFKNLINYLNSEKDIIEKVEFYVNKDRVSYDFSALEVPISYFYL